MKGDVRPLGFRLVTIAEDGTEQDLVRLEPGEVKWWKLDQVEHLASAEDDGLSLVTGTGAITLSFARIPRESI